MPRKHSLPWTHALKVVEKYWVSYYLVYAASAAFLLWRHWKSLRWDDESYVYLTAAIFGMSVGIALMAAIVVEVAGRMLLLIPDAIRKIKEQGRKEARKEHNDRVIEAYQRFGMVVDGVTVLPRTPEVEAFLSGKSPKD